MQRHRRTITAGDMISATYQSKSRVEEILERARVIEADTRKDLRLKRNECRACFYTPRIGGAMMTSRACAICGSVETYCSTNTDALCLKCAKEHSLCKHCGGDLEMRTRRKNWPDLGGTSNG